jgi:hypothetical protein
MTGGANDTNWVSELVNWYIFNPLSGFADHKPWQVTSRPGCPNTDSIYATLQAANMQITNNLYGVVKVAHRASPGVRILNVGYPQVVDSGNPCYGDQQTFLPYIGAAHVIEGLNDDHKGVMSKNTKYVDTTAALGEYPVSDGRLQLTRLYGYPHPSGTGQALISTAAQAVLAGSQW